MTATTMTTPTNDRSASPIPASGPYRWALPRDERDADPLLLRLDFHQECCVLTDYQGAGGCIQTRLVAPLDVARTLARELAVTTPLLPASCLWWAKTATAVNMGIYVPAQVQTVRLATMYGEQARELRLPFPPLVFVHLSNKAPYVFAARGRPTSAEDQLLHTPAYNVFPSGRVCVGTHAFPAEPELLPRAFFESRFSVALDTASGKSRRHPDDIGRLWAELEGQETYPLDDLAPQLTVADAMRLGE